MKTTLLEAMLVQTTKDSLYRAYDSRRDLA